MDSTYSVLLQSPYAFNLSSDQSVQQSLYGRDQYLPSGVDYFLRDQGQLGVTKDSLDILPEKEAPIGDQKTRQPNWYHNDQYIEPSSKTYSSGLTNPLQLPGWQKTKVLGFLLNPYQIRDEQDQTNQKIMKKFYSRSVPQRTSTSDRGLN
jgi:hypothetical protein